MRSSSYWSRKTTNLRELGHWFAADECKRMAAKARRNEQRKKRRKGMA